jgi:hypothetical protein
MSKGRKAGLLGTIGAALLALTTGAWSAAPAQPVSPEQAPQAWVMYAQRVSERFQSAIASDAQPAQAFQAFVDDRIAAETPASGPGVASDAIPDSLSTLRIKAWFDEAGQVTRVEIEGVDDPRAEADLRALLLAQSVNEAPPRRMPQPVIVRLMVGAEI